MTRRTLLSLIGALAGAKAWARERIVVRLRQRQPFYPDARIIVVSPDKQSGSRFLKDEIMRITHASGGRITVQRGRKA
ncbi:MAG: hypothetical protein GY906_22570 [bacterium]|nr:hypothetical protein [bacterium]